MPNISVYHKCDNRCVMCSNPRDFIQSPAKDFSLARLSRRLKNFSLGRNVFLENFRDAFILSGGEPTMSPDLFPVIRRVATLFPQAQITCLTNGRAFSREAYAREFMRRFPLVNLVIPVHGHTASLHDRITRVKGSFTQTLRGLQVISALMRPTQLLELRVVLHGLNYRWMKEIARFLRAQVPSAGRVVFIFVEIEGEAAKNWRRIGVTYTQVRPFLREAASELLRLPDPRLYHFPLCLVPRALFPLVFRTLPEAEIMFPVQCRLCALKSCCLGVHRGYAGGVGVDEFRPFRRKIRFVRTGNWYHPIGRVL